MGSSGWSPGLWWRPNSPGDPRLAKLCSQGTPRISCIVNLIREKEIDALVMPWVNAQVVYLLAVQWATATVENDKIAAGESDPSEYDKVVTTKDTETIGAPWPHVIHARKGMAGTGEGINMMTQALHTEDESLPQGLTVQNTYMEFHNGSKNVAVVVRNSTAYPQILRKKTPVVGQLQSHGYQSPLCRPA